MVANRENRDEEERELLHTPTRFGLSAFRRRYTRLKDGEGHDRCPLFRTSPNRH